jgi:Raf kinase inhibitor-like YbhB/YbcL family protein
LKWTEPPEGTKTFALIADDPDAPMGTWVHWVAYNIPPATRQFPEGVPTVDKLKDGTLQGMNDFGKVGYNGPMPPPGKPHRYFFKLYAVDAALTLPARASKKDVEKALKEHILAEVRLMGTYKR